MIPVHSEMMRLVLLAKRQMVLTRRAGLVAELHAIDELLAEPPPAEAVPVMREPAAPPPAEHVFTPARDAIIRSDWPAGVPARVIKQKLDALPGRPVPLDRIAIRASTSLGVRRPPRKPFRIGDDQAGREKVQ